MGFRPWNKLSLLIFRALYRACLGKSLVNLDRRNRKTKRAGNRFPARKSAGLQKDGGQLVAPVPIPMVVMAGESAADDDANHAADQRCRRAVAAIIPVTVIAVGAAPVRATIDVLTAITIRAAVPV